MKHVLVNYFIQNYPNRIEASSFPFIRSIQVILCLSLLSYLFNEYMKARPYCLHFLVPVCLS